jgi:hypothetical protein
MLKGQGIDKYAIWAYDCTQVWQEQFNGSPIQEGTES